MEHPCKTQILRCPDRFGRMVHTGRHSYCTPFPQQKPFSLHQAEALWLYRDETTGAGQQKARAPKQARSPSREPSPSSAPCHCRQRQSRRQACSLFFLIPVPLGHPLVEKPDICRNAEGAKPKWPGSFKMTCKL